MDKKIFSVLAVLSTLAFVSGFIIKGHFLTENKKKPIEEQLKCSYKFINPNACYSEKTDNSPGKIQLMLKKRFTDYLEKYMKSGELLNIALYYRDLKYGSIVQIQSSDDFLGASLYKVPLMIVFLKAAEENNKLLQEKVTIEKDFSFPQDAFNTPKHIQIGKTYTIVELIEYMIIESDNASKYILDTIATKMFKKSFISQIYENLGIEYPIESEIHIQQYAGIFRILYNSTYLDPKMSNLALSILSRSSFDLGIARGVPKSVMVANKYGYPPKAERQLHDCGIVYYRNPYILCIFSEGESPYFLDDIISNLSKIAYETVSL